MKYALFALLLAACGGDKEEEDLSAVSYDAAAPEGGMVPNTPGPGASVVCDSSGKNAFDTYGATTIVVVNENIFANVNTETKTYGAANLGSSFMEVGTGSPASTADGAATFKGKLGAFLIWAYGGPPTFQYTDGITYTGVIDMTQAHEGLAITQMQYDYFISNIVVPALTAAGVHSGAGDDADDVTSCFGSVLTATSFSSTIIGQ